MQQRTGWIKRSRFHSVTIPSFCRIRLATRLARAFQNPTSVRRAGVNAPASILEAAITMGGTQHVRWKRLGSTAAAAALAAVLVAGVTACPASANSGETIGFGACYVAQQICIPRGTFTINTGSVGGSGNRINYVSGGFTYVGQICNLWIDHDFYAANGVRVGHIQGPEKYGCFSVAAQSC